MKRFLPFLFAAALLPAWGQNSLAPYQIADNNAPPPSETPPPDQHAAATAASELAQSTQKKHANTAADQVIIDQFASNNRDLLNLLKQQQAVLEDIQYDRRLQNRQITLLEDRLEDTLQTNTALQVKIAKLETELAAASEKPTAAATPATPASPAHSEVAAAPVVPPPPSTYLPAAAPDGPPGTAGWHRLLTISGENSKNSEVFHIEGRRWRVLWHNQDRPGPAYKNTSALFINAFPKNDIIPKKVCSQLGSGGDTTELTGKGDYYLKIEASGGHWEAAVEDFH